MRRGPEASGRRVRAWVSWSTGKESALSLCMAQADPRLEVAGLFTTMDEEPCRVAYNGVPVRLAEAQAAALGLPLHLLRVPAGCDDGTREALRREVLTREAVPAGVEAILFGDVGGTDIRASRAERLAGLGIDALFPLWGAGTRCLSQHILAVGIRAVVTRLDSHLIDPKWAGQPYGEVFIGALARMVDPCGEHGEFHTFVCDGPGFGQAIPVVSTGARWHGRTVYAGLTEANGPADRQRRSA